MSTMASLTILLDAASLKALRSSKSITIGGSNAGTAPTDRGARPGGGGGQFREGSLPAKLTAWAKGRKRGFGVPDVMKKFNLSRAHASMVLSRVAGAGTVRRAARGVYQA